MAGTDTAIAIGIGTRGIVRTIGTTTIGLLTGTIHGMITVMAVGTITTITQAGSHRADVHTVLLPMELPAVITTVTTDVTMVVVTQETKEEAAALQLQVHTETMIVAMWVAVVTGIPAVAVEMET